MALPAIADVRRAFPSARLIVSARRPVVDVVPLGPPVDDVVALQWNGALVGRAPPSPPMRRASATSGRTSRFCCRIRLPPHGWRSRRGYRRGGGTPPTCGARCCPRAVRRPSGRLHQGAYYQHLTRALGIASGPSEPVLTVPERAAVSARRRLPGSGLGWRPPGDRLRAGRRVRRRPALDSTPRRAARDRSRHASARGRARSSGAAEMPPWRARSWVRSGRMPRRTCST